MHVRTPIKVRYGETDMMGVVYHANYLLYFEDARIDFLNTVGASYAAIENAGYMSPIHDIDVTYGTPLRYGEDAFVLTRVVRSTPTKTTYAQDVYRADMDPATDKPLVAAHVTCCIVERATFKPVSIKRTFPELYALYQEIIEPEA